jgi:hypothetical protein
MAKSADKPNGRDRLEEAMTMLIRNEAAFVARLSDSDKRHAENERLRLKYEQETAETFAQIKADMAAIIRVLGEHTRMLERLPEAIRDKIGFKAPQEGKA